MASATDQLWDGFVNDVVRPLTLGEKLFFQNKRVLITGGGGFLGAFIAEELAELGVERLVLLDTAEYGLYRLEQRLTRRQKLPSLRLVLGSVEDGRLLRELFEEHAPEIVFHAAALKHVPLLESNALAVAQTNVLGTRTLVHEARRHTLPSFVLLSTDKAVAPSSVMGATKRIAEQMVLQEHSAGRTAFRVARLCNVLGSMGSVAPLFARQLLQGDAVTVTHPDATRFFLSTADAVRFLLRAAGLPMATGLVAPRLGPARRVEELAHYMIERAAKQSRHANITYTGLRVADKLHEQMISPTETLAPQSDTVDALEIQSAFDAVQLERACAAIQLAVEARDQARLFEAIRGTVPDYSPVSTVPVAQVGL